MHAGKKDQQIRSYSRFTLSLHLNVQKVSFGYQAARIICVQMRRFIDSNFILPMYICTTK